ncbi:uncharacterized protein [Triticum aestivum]|uniref:uncharacterized protein n=1 Tax=Triticum aestivum TaxID=4565 RepID=UPI001D033A6B|nr:uncharacterized protein LOC123132387 [Triticum aestivum]
MRLLCGEPGRGPLGGAACRGCGVRRARRTDASATVLDEVVAATVMARRRDGEQQWPLVPVQEIRKRHGVRAERSQAEGSVVAPMRATASCPAAGCNDETLCACRPEGVAAEGGRPWPYPPRRRSARM